MAAAEVQGAPREVLRRVFGFPVFRGLQEQVIEHLLGGGDALVLMPTGGGKSVCYQVPALRQLGIAAGALHSDLDPDEQRRVGRELDSGRLDLLYVSPERLL